MGSVVRDERRNGGEVGSIAREGAGSELVEGMVEIGRAHV